MVPEDLKQRLKDIQDKLPPKGKSDTIVVFKDKKQDDFCPRCGTKNVDHISWAEPHIMNSSITNERVLICNRCGCDFINIKEYIIDKEYYIVYPFTIKEILK